MANSTNVAIISTANTFDQWRIRDNLQANDVNEIARGNFTKPTGNVIITDGYLLLDKATGTTLTVDANARVSGLLSAGNIESDDTGNVLIQSGNVALSNRASGALFQANINVKFDSANVIFSNSNIHFTNSSQNAVLNVKPNTIFQTNVNVDGVLFVATSANVFIANITNVHASNIRIDSDPIYYIQNGNSVFNDVQVRGNLTVLGSSVNDSDIFTLRQNVSSDGDGIFRIKRGSTGKGNAELKFNATADVWQATANANGSPTHLTILTTQNVTDSVSSTSTVNAAAPNSVKTAYDQATNARDQANTARDQANTARDQANTARDQANTARDQANTARDTANGAYTQANGAYSQANGAYGQANGAYAHANVVYAQANAAYDTANGAYTQANGAYAQANGAYSQANNAANTVATFANGTLVLAASNLNFNNTATINVDITANGTVQTNVQFSVNTSADGVAIPSYLIVYGLDVLGIT
jgi:hypothetical protein